jgi:hypothetical protein
MRVEYDHYSKQCPSHPIPPIHPEDVEDLITKVQLYTSFIQMYIFFILFNSNTVTLCYDSTIVFK